MSEAAARSALATSLERHCHQLGLSREAGEAVSAFPGVIGISRDGAAPLTLFVDEAIAGLARDHLIALLGKRCSIAVLGTPVIRAHRFVSRDRPVRPGSSVGLVDGEAGTLTIVTRRRATAERYLLSCEHVFDLATSPRVSQPAAPDAFDKGRHDEVATVTATAGLRERVVHSLDAAIARLRSDVFAQNLTLGLEAPLTGTTGTIDRGSPVKIFGRSSGKSGGEVLSPAVDIRVQFPQFGRGEERLLQGLVRANYLSSPGDSGAPVICARTGALTGMHVAGVASGEDSYFCPIDRVLNHFNLELA